MKKLFLKTKSKFQENYKKHGKKFLIGYTLWLIFKWTVGLWLFSYLFKA
jgi:hypothetical protein